MINTEISFRDFKDSDFASYQKLNNLYRFDCKKQNDKEYLSKVENTGFLMGGLVTKSYLKEVIFSQCALVSGEMAGIVRVEKMTNKMASKKSKLSWLGSNKLRNKFSEEKGWLIGLVLVAPEFKRKGIAKLLIKRIESYAKKNNCEDLFSWVATKLNNMPSFRLHQEMGFKVVAIYDAVESFDILNYQSKLFYKHIK